MWPAQVGKYIGPTQIRVGEFCSFPRQEGSETQNKGVGSLYGIRERVASNDGVRHEY